MKTTDTLEYWIVHSDLWEDYGHVHFDNKEEAYALRDSHHENKPQIYFGENRVYVTKKVIPIHKDYKDSYLKEKQQ